MPGNPAAHFGKQLRKERTARGWSLDELSRRVGIAAGHLSRIENGKRPPTEAVAAACDTVFTERRGWFTEYYQESRTWMPAGFRDWSELENNAARLSVWSPGIVHGLLQSEGYAGALLATLPGATAEAVQSRLAARMERQRRVLLRDDPPSAWFIIDHAALYRCVGSPPVMAAQCARLAEVAAFPHVTIQVLPAVGHPATQSGFTVTGAAAYAEHAFGGYVFTEEQTVTGALSLFDTLRSECYRASESLAVIGKAADLWTGESRPTAARTAATA